MSHEISEWMNNPFGGNAVPAWQVPNSTGCQSNLETGDPLALMPNAGYPCVDRWIHLPSAEPGIDAMVPARNNIRCV